MRAYESFPPPPEQLIALAREAQSEGLPFEDFWERAVRPGKGAVVTTTPRHRRPDGCVIWPSDSVDCRGWREAIQAGRETWRRCYEGEPATRSERALNLLAPVILKVAAAADRESVSAAR